eukprot:scaffold54268_cov69-Phaeocystis_antarctica.AAC.1
MGDGVPTIWSTNWSTIWSPARKVHAPGEAGVRHAVCVRNAECSHEVQPWHSWCGGAGGGDRSHSAPTRAGTCSMRSAGRKQVAAGVNWREVNGRRPARPRLGSGHLSFVSRAS